MQNVLGNGEFMQLIFPISRQPPVSRMVCLVKPRSEWSRLIDELGVARNVPKWNPGKWKSRLQPEMIFPPQKKAQVISPTACGGDQPAALAEPRRTLVEPSWNLTSGSPWTTPEPIWTETPKLSAVGEKRKIRHRPEASESRTTRLQHYFEGRESNMFSN